MTLKPKQFARYFLLLFVLLTLPMVVLSLATDPFWIWQKQPHWLAANEGKNINLDRRMRLAKALQIFTRPTDTVIIGSSKVTRGFDVGASSYNYGISALSATELEQCVSHLERWRHPAKLIVGLDYAMFDAQTQRDAGDVPEMLKPGYVFEALLETLFSRDAVDAIRLAQDPYGNQRGWYWNGRQEGSPMVGDDAQWRARNIAADLTAAQTTDDAVFAALERSLAVAHAHGTHVAVYFSPVHRSIREQMAAAGAWPKVEAWKARVREIATAQGATVYDFTEAPFTNDTRLTRTGSTDMWYDPSHFTPKAGAWMLVQMR